MPVYAGLLGDLLYTATPERDSADTPDDANRSTNADEHAVAGVDGCLTDTVGDVLQKPQSEEQAARSRANGSPATLGTFSTPFAEPTIVVDG